MSVLVIAAIYITCALAVVLLADQIAARTFKVSRQAKQSEIAFAGLSSGDHNDPDISL